MRIDLLREGSERLPLMELLGPGRMSPPSFADLLRCKLDEGLPRRAAGWLVVVGHDALTVAGEGLVGQPRATVASHNANHASRLQLGIPTPRSSGKTASGPAARNFTRDRVRRRRPSLQHAR